MNKEFTVPKGKDFAIISASGHKYVRVLDAEGNEIFRSNSPGEFVTAIVDPGRYNVDTDGKIDKVDYGTLDERYRKGRPVDAGKPPDAGRPKR
jgi:hypothetical protein